MRLLGLGSGCRLPGRANVTPTHRMRRSEGGRISRATQVVRASQKVYPPEREERQNFIKFWTFSGFTIARRILAPIGAGITIWGLWIDKLGTSGGGKFIAGVMILYGIYNLWQLARRNFQSPLTRYLNESSDPH